jgi:hypothetical protein
MLRIPHSVENRFTDGSEVVSLKRRKSSTPQKNFLILICLTSSVDPGTILGIERLGYVNALLGN